MQFHNLPVHAYMASNRTHAIIKQQIHLVPDVVKFWKKIAIVLMYAFCQSVQSVKC